MRPLRLRGSPASIVSRPDECVELVITADMFIERACLSPDQTGLSFRQHSLMQLIGTDFEASRMGRACSPLERSASISPDGRSPMARHDGSARALDAPRRSGFRARLNRQPEANLFRYTQGWLSVHITQQFGVRTKPTPAHESCKLKQLQRTHPLHAVCGHELRRPGSLHHGSSSEDAFDRRETSDDDLISARPAPASGVRNGQAGQIADSGHHQLMPVAKARIH